VTYETAGRWERSSKAFSNQIRQRTFARGDKWSLDESSSPSRAKKVALAQVISTSATFLSVAHLFHVPYPDKTTAKDRRPIRAHAFAVWRDVPKVSTATVARRRRTVPLLSHDSRRPKVESTWRMPHKACPGPATTLHCEAAFPSTTPCIFNRARSAIGAIASSFFSINLGTPIGLDEVGRLSRRARFLAADACKCAHGWAVAFGVFG
jgi:hypothetical protein